MADTPFPRAPLRFREILLEKPWGGRRLGTLLGKRLPAKKNIGESLEVACREGATSVVAEGPFKGKRLDAVLAKFPTEILGKEVAGGWRGRFPLLFKYIDAATPLSIQVHPSDELAVRAEGDGASGKIEAWVVLSAGPKARLWKGLVPGMTREKFAAAIARGAALECVNAFPISEGDVILLPPGTVHAAEDIVVAEFQQNSDTTYRLFDWERRGPGGRLRELHVDKGLAATDFHSTGLAKCLPSEIRENVKTYGLFKGRRGPGKLKREMLVWCSRFALESLRLTGEATFNGDASRFYIVTAVEGSGSFVVDGKSFPWKTGQTFLMPAAIGDYAIKSRAGRLLICYVP